MKNTIKKLPKSQIEVEFELTADEFQKYLEGALLKLKDQVKMDGFRKGAVPLKMVEEKIGNENLLMEAGDLAVKKSYRDFVTESKLEPIGDPEVQIKKIAKGSPFEFVVKISVLPEIVLPDYQEIAKKVKGQDILVDEKEVEDAVIYLQKSKAKLSPVERGAEPKDFVEIEYQNSQINGGKIIQDSFILNEGGFLKDFEDNILGMKAGDEKEFKAKFPDNTPNKELAGKESDFKVRMVLVQKMELPEIDDELAKSLGQDASGVGSAGSPVSAFDSLVSLKENIRGGITMEKQEGERQRKRGEVLHNVSQKITFDLPEKMVDYESARLFEDFKNQIAQNAKIDFDEYLASVKKDENEVKKSFSLEAEKRIRNFLVLREIGKAENIEVDEKELNEEMTKVMQRYSKEQLEKIDVNELREYTKGAIYNEKVFEKLESFSKI